MSFFKKGNDKVKAKKDLDIVISYIKAGLTTDLNRNRYKQTTGISLDLNDELLIKASELVNSIINDIDAIKKRTIKFKKDKLATKNTKNASLSPDENHQIDMSSLKDIKVAGLKRPLTAEERRLLKTATARFNRVYSDQLKLYGPKDKVR